ncbi:MAG: OmpA family protein, partial [Myxococcota bacterium]|nr:OmpA family protein [Myxococcota bacterium]
TDPLLSDSDIDGLPDGAEDANQNGQVDDGETNPTIADSDGDGVIDGDEVKCNTDPLDGSKVPTNTIDPDECDGAKTDTDSDGVADGVENLCGTDPEDPSSLPSIAALGDTDGDGLVDCVDTDDDDDAIPDVFEEVCGTDTTNEEDKPPLIDVLDTDGDGFRNCIDADDDGDGLVDVDEDLNQDGLVTTCAIDEDTGEQVDADCQSETNPYDADTDDDGLFDGVERDSHLTDPLLFDTDGDGLSDGLELGITTEKLDLSTLGDDTDRSIFVPDACPESKTDPTRADTDDDAKSDGEEDVNKDGCFDDCADEDGDGVQDDLTCVPEYDPNKQGDVELDSDGDGLSDVEEVEQHNTNPQLADTDGDGLSDGGEVQLFKTAPLIADTDGGGVNDGDEVANRTNPLDPDDDYSIGKLSGGNDSNCGTSSGGSSTAIWLVMGAFALLAWRRWTRFIPWLLVLVVLAQLAPSAARAQSTRVDAVNVFTFLPVGGHYRHWSVEQSLISPHLKPYASVLFHLENDSLTLVTGGARESLVDFAAFADFNVGIGLFDWVSLEVALPVALALHSGPNVQSVGVQRGAGLGDLIARLRTRLISNQQGGFGLALTAGAVIPTGDGAAFRGDDGVSILAGLISDFRTTSTVTSLNIGVRVRTFSSQFFDSIIDHDLNFGLGFDATVWRNWVTIGTEVFGRTQLTDPFGTKENTSIEFLAGPKIGLYEGVTWQLAVGAGLVRGRGTPQYRFVSGFVYAPRIQDSDMDGIVERLDMCPLDKEDKDDFRDADGCPDDDNDGDGIKDLADRCPATPEDSNGIESEDGCPDADQDADGIVDVYDRCPYAKEDHDRFQDEDGCPERDNDADSILDVYDACPNVAETYNGREDDDGCPDATPKVASLPCSPKCSFSVQNVLRFTERKDRLTTVHRRFLDELAERLIQNELISEVRVTGYAWEEGPRGESKRIARRRAEETVQYLQSKGVPGVLLTTHDVFHDGSWKKREKDRSSVRPAEKELTPEQRRYRASNRENTAEMRRVTFKVIMNARCGTGRTGPACGRTEPDPQLSTPPVTD